MITSASDLITVPGSGPLDADIMFVGERPGYHESLELEPFVGPSGEDLARFLGRTGISLPYCYKTNVCKTYHPDNLDPTDDDIDLDELTTEIATVAPVWLVAVGRIAARTLLGYPVAMEWAHGMVYQSLPRFGSLPTIIAYHPAFSLHSPAFAPLVSYDYRRVGAYITGKLDPYMHTDDYAGREDYRVLDDDEYQLIEDACQRGELAIDTEGFRSDPWMIQFSADPGTGYIIERRQHHLITHLDECIARHDPLVIFHYAVHDIEVMRALEMRSPRRYTDTMELAYVLQVEPQGLKALARRHAGMEMDEYRDIVNPIQESMSARYFDRIRKCLTTHPEWSETHEYLTIEDGLVRRTRPWSIATRIKSITNAARKAKRAGEEFSHLKRWKKFPSHTQLEIETAVGARMPIATLMNVPLKKRNHYAARDSDATLRVYRPLRAMVEEMQLNEVVEMDLACMPMWERMQANGFHVNIDKLLTLSDDLKAQMDTAQDIVGCNPNSGPQLIPIFDELGLPRPKKTTKKLKLPQVDDSYLEGLETDLKAGKWRSDLSTSSMSRDPFPIVQATLRYRECDKLRSTYADPIAALAQQSPDGRVRSTILTTRVVTGRPSMKEPNLLNIPTRTELGKRVQDAFEPEPGHVFCTADYSGIEMRVMAHMSGDENMIAVFNEGRDLHSETASRAFGIPIDQLDKMKHRYPAKRMGFLVIYGGGADKLQSELRAVGEDWTIEACEDLIDDYIHKLYPDIGRYMSERKQEAKRYGYVRDPMSGRIRYVPDASSHDKWKQLAAFREAINFPIQAGAATIMKRGMKRCWDRLQIEIWNRDMYAEPLLQLYDELLFEASEDCVEDLRLVVVDSMASAMELSVPIEVSWATGYTWAELEK